MDSIRYFEEDALLPIPNRTFFPFTISSSNLFPQNFFSRRITWAKFSFLGIETSEINVESDRSAHFALIAEPRPTLRLKQNKKGVLRVKV